MDTPGSDFLQRLRATFRVEAAEHVQAIAGGLIALEKARAQERAAVVETVFREAHSLKGAARAVDYAEVERLCQEMEEVFSAWRRGADAPTADALDDMHRLLAAIDVALAAAGGSAPVPMPTPAASPGASAALSFAPSVPPAPPVPGAESAAPEPAADTTVRVPVGKLETCLVQAEEMLSAKLMTAQRASDVRELCGGLAQWDGAWSAVQAQLGQLRRAKGACAQDLEKLLEFVDWNAGAVKEMARRAAALERQVRQDRYQVDRLVDDLLEESKLLLLLPFDSITGSFARLVRDLCREQGKLGQLRVIGGDIELDKRILEEIKDPLIHLLRNAVDHGIEPPAERVAKGKPEAASLLLSVSQIGAGLVEIVLSDDGAGVDAKAVARAAVARGLAADGNAAPEEAALELIFASEVSTTAAVTTVSGRGLGLAIVREKAEKLGGRVTVATEPGQGTAFRIQLPATQATFRGILVMAGGQLLVLPTRSVERVLRLAPSQVHSVEGRSVFSFDGRAVSLVRLDDILELAPDPAVTPQPAGTPVLVLASGEQRVGFAVDRVIDEQEVLVKRLRAPLVRVRNVAGATVLGSGRVAPVLDVADLLKSARRGGALRHFAPPERPRQKASVLLAEDSVTSRMLLRGILEAAGYRVKTAADGLEAHALLRQEAFDVLVSDVEMPGLNGFELARRVRSDDKLKELPVILVTALETPEDRERGLDAGADAYIVKSSFDQGELLAAIGRLL